MTKSILYFSIISSKVSINDNGKLFDRVAISDLNCFSAKIRYGSSDNEFISNVFRYLGDIS